MRHLLLEAFILSFIFLSIECGQSDYEYVPEMKAWIQIHKVPALWNDARLRCKLEGGVLASPVNQQLLFRLSRVVSEHFPSGIYTGIHDTFSNGDYFSVEGIPLEKMPIKWSPNEPNNYENGEHCIILENNGTVADVKCTKVYPYVCYRKTLSSGKECDSINDGYQLDVRTNSCYKFHSVGRPWPRAFMACSAEGAHLAIINSELEARVLSELYSKHPDANITGVIKHVASIGFHNWGETRVWTTIHGLSIEEAGYAKFNDGQPDYSGKGWYCGGMFRNGRLDDLTCEVTTPFICEKPPVEALVDEVPFESTPF